MLYKVYILYSKKLNRYYKGSTKNLEQRLKRHNAGNSSYTSKGIPWELVFSIEKESLKEVLILERKLKNLNRERLESFIEKYKNILDED
jgi:putative endonuclease